MRPSSDRLADDNDGVRASDAERDRAIGELRDRFAEGRLSQETFLVRLDPALNAKDRADLSGLFTDRPTEAKRPGRGGRRQRLRWPGRAAHTTPAPATPPLPPRPARHTLAAARRRVGA